MTPEERQHLEELVAFKKALESSTTIPRLVDGAFRERLKDISLVRLSSKDTDSEDVTVNESGSNSYAVMNDPDGFLQTSIGGTTYYIPYFT